MDIRLATQDDFDGVKALLKANHVDSLSEEEKKEGFVTTNLTDSQLTELITKEKGVTIAVDNDKVVAFALAAPWEYWSVWPLFEHMIAIMGEYEFRGKPLSAEYTYQYGPICIEKSYRGSGLFKKVFMYSLATMKDRYPVMVTFVNRVNPRSHAAHTRKAGMEISGTFDFNNNHYWMMACPTTL